MPAILLLILEVFITGVELHIVVLICTSLWCSWDQYMLTYQQLTHCVIYAGN